MQTSKERVCARRPQLVARKEEAVEMVATPSLSPIP